MRYELNFDEDKVNDVLVKGGASYDLKGCCELLNKQQDIIFKLQDLCGKSDGENMKLRNEIKLLKPTNIEQYEQIVQLQEENEKLRKELGDCEKFRYQVFKRMNDEYIKECSIR